jgi:hypothetical protein
MVESVPRRRVSRLSARADSRPVPPKQIATAMIALDVGLAIQHLVDPEEAPLDDYVPLFDLLIGRLAEPDAE